MVELIVYCSAMHGVTRTLPERSLYRNASREYVVFVAEWGEQVSSHFSHYRIPLHGVQRPIGRTKAACFLVEDGKVSSLYFSDSNTWFLHYRYTSDSPRKREPSHFGIQEGE